MFPDESASVGLPIRIVVLTIIGMVGIYAIMSAVTNTPFVPCSMSAASNSSSFSIAGNAADSPFLQVSVSDDEGRPVGGANVIVWDPCKTKVAAGITDGSGEFNYRLQNISLPQGKTEGYLSVKVMEEGYLDYNNDYFVKVKKV